MVAVDEKKIEKKKKKKKSTFLVSFPDDENALVKMDLCESVSVSTH